MLLSCCYNIYMETFKVVVFYLLLLDSLTAFFLAWGNSRWFARHFRIFSRYFPLAKGWATWYLVLVLWIGFLTL